MRVKLMLPMLAMLFSVSAGEAWAGPVVVACGPGQHAIVRNAFVRGETVTRVACVRGTTYQTSSYDRREVVRYRQAHRRHRSWGKTALVVGGSAATGAGIGGAIHGKKGALVGGALGGGIGSLYEAARRR